MHIHKARAMKEDSIKKAAAIMEKAMKASEAMAKYPEELSDKGLAELLIFSVAASLYMESDEDVIFMTLGSLIIFISADSELCMSKEEVQKHVLERIPYFTGLLSDIAKDPQNFDVKPIYCALYRSPMTDVKYAPVSPKEPDVFVKIVREMIISMNNFE